MKNFKAMLNAVDKTKLKTTQKCPPIPKSTLMTSEGKLPKAPPTLAKPKVSAPMLPASAKLPDEIAASTEIKRFVKTTVRSMTEPLEPESFPDIRKTKDGVIKLRQTKENAEHLIRSYGITTAFNVITNRVEITVPNASGSPTNIDNTSMTQIISLAKRNDLGTDQISAYAAAIADANPKNPVMDWITSKPWDGIDRLPDLYNTITPQDNFPLDLRDTFIRRWLISAVAAAAFHASFRARGVLTTQGKQSIGKTSWLASLVPNQTLRDIVIKVDHLLDVTNKDSVLQAISHWLVELGELESCFKRDQARLKGFITSTGDKIRAPYARAPMEIPRHSIFYATVNDSQFLVDQSNTRFWTIPVKAINYQHGLDMQQIWAQVHELYKSDEQWWLTPDEERRLEELNRSHRVVSVIRERIESELDFDAPIEKWRRLTASGLLRDMGKSNPSNTEAKECAQVLREHFDQPKKSQGAMRWLVPPILIEPVTPVSNGKRTLMTAAVSEHLQKSTFARDNIKKAQSKKTDCIPPATPEDDTIDDF